MSIQFKGETEQHLIHSPFSSMDDVFRFIDWFSKNKEYATHWDIHRYNCAVDLIQLITDDNQ